MARVRQKPLSTLLLAALTAITLPSAPSIAQPLFTIPQRFQGSWRPYSEACSGDSAERYDLRAHTIDEQEIDTFIRRLHTTGNRLDVVVEEGYSPDLKRRTIHFVLALDGKSMLVDGAAYKRCPQPNSPPSRR